MVVIARHRAVLARLRLDTLEGVRTFHGDLVKNHRGRRDIHRIVTTDDAGRPLTLFLKRNWRPYKKDGLLSLLRRGRVWSISRQEWENSLTLERAGVATAPLVAYGEDCGPVWERFSFILTAAAIGPRTLQEFLQDRRSPGRRAAVLAQLAREIRTMHDAGLASPDLFCRHIFVDDAATPPRFCLIDMARLDVCRTLSAARRARDLAALHVTAPLRFVALKERLRFLRAYAGGGGRVLRRLVVRRADHLLKRRKFHDFAAPVREPV